MRQVGMIGRTSFVTEIRLKSFYIYNTTVNHFERACMQIMTMEPPGRRRGSIPKTTCVGAVDVRTTGEDGQEPSLTNTAAIPDSDNGTRHAGKEYDNNN